MLHISSRDNPLYKHVKRLMQGRTDRRFAGDGSNRDDMIDLRPDHELRRNPDTIPVVLEGIHLCQDWLQHRGQPQRAIFDARRLRDSSELQALAQRVDGRHAVSMDTTLIKSISPIAMGQGVLFLVDHDIPIMPERIDHACIWLDRIQDPGNVGTLLRTAAAAGMTHAYLSKECASAWSPRVLRGAQGAHFAMTLHEQVDLMKAYERLDVPLCATAITDAAVSLYEGRLPATCAWVFGNEGQGVEPRLLALADRCVTIPQQVAVESLNVAVAAGICLFEQLRQQQGQQKQDAI